MDWETQTPKGLPNPNQYITFTFNFNFNFNSKTLLSTSYFFIFITPHLPLFFCYFNISLGSCFWVTCLTFSHVHVNSPFSCTALLLDDHIFLLWLKMSQSMINYQTLEEEKLILTFWTWMSQDFDQLTIISFRYIFSILCKLIFSLFFH